jgi:hypothetical protein
MANGQQKAQQNLDAFQAWYATQTDDDFKQIVFRGQLNRGEVAKAIGCGKSALNQNPALKDALAKVEADLRVKGVLPPEQPLVALMKGEVKEYDKTANRKARDNNHLSKLEVENIELRAENKELREKLERFKELSETLSEMGLMPR